MPIAPALLDFVDDELARAPLMIERTHAGTVQALRAGQEDWAALAQRGPSATAAEALQAHAAAYQRAFDDALRQRVHEALHDEHGQAAAAGREAGPEPLDEAGAEIDIELARAIHMIDTTAEWELRELQSFTSTLAGRTHVSAGSNPLRPQVYVLALWQAACAVTPLPALRTTLLRHSSRVLAGLLKNAWAAACRRLEMQGIEPGLHRSIVLAAGAPRGRGVPLPDVDNPSTMTGLLTSMPGGSAGMRVSVTNAAVAMGSPAHLATHGAFDPPLQQALARLDKVLRTAPAAPDPAAAEAAADAMRWQRARLVEAAGTAPERQVIELVARVFDAIAADPQVPAAFAPALARLRASALRVALRDPDMPGTTRHVAWQLIDRIGEVALAAPPGEARGATRLALCHALTTQLANAAAPDAALYRRALKQLDALLANQLSTQLQAVQPVVQVLQHAELRELLAQQLAQRLTEQMATMQPATAIRRFIVDTWSRVLAEAILRDGEEADSTRGCIKLVDDLLWSVQLPDHPTSRQRLIGMLPGLLKQLRDGMALIALPAAEQERVFDALRTIHTEALRPGRRGAPTQALSPEEIVQRLREEVLPPITVDGAWGHLMGPLGAMDEMVADARPANAHPAAPGDPGQEVPVEPHPRIAELVAGTRLRLFLHGRWRRVQLLWRSDKGRLFLFAAEAEGPPHAVGLRALERLAEAGLVRPLERRTLVQRALEAVMRDLGRGA